MPALAPPDPVSGRPLAGAVKRVVRKVTAWQIDPIVHQINKLQQTALASADATDEALRGPTDDAADGGSR